MTDDFLGDEFAPAPPPSDITHLLRERMEARASHDWDRADDLKAQIEAAGWRVVDRGKRSSVHPAAPASVEVGGERRYGSAADVPDAWAFPATASFTVALVVSEEPGRVSRLLAALREHAPAGTQVVIVENDPSDAQAAALRVGAPDRGLIGGAEPEILRTSVRLGYAAALNIALRRAAGEIVLLADGSAVPSGDAFTKLAEAFADPEVVAVGPFGLLAEDGVPLRPNDLERAAPDPDADLEVAALEGAWLAFRRDDLIELGAVEEHFVTSAWLDVWLSLRLRTGPMEPPVFGSEAAHEATDEGDGEATDEASDAAASATDGNPDGERDGVEGAEAAADSDSEGSADVAGQALEEMELAAPRRALMIDLPLVRDETPWPPERTRLNRRNMYRVLDTFGWRDDLA